jgi:cytochrome c
MRKAVISILLVLAFLPCGQAWSAERGTREEAQALVARAIDAYESDGEEAFKRITAPSTEFADRDLYVFVIGPDHKLVANAATSRYLGTYFPTLRDPDGKLYGQEMISEAREVGAWVEYRFPDPQTGEILPKSTWVVLHDGYIFAAGIYQP